MARTTLNLDPSVMDELRKRSRSERKSIGEIASELLARGLDEGPTPTPEPLRWMSADLGLPMVDLEDKEALAAALER